VPNIDGGIECSSPGWVGERDEGVAEQVEGRAPVIEPEVRGSMAGSAHRQVFTDRVSGARLGRVVGCDDSRMIDLSQHEPIDRIRWTRGAQARVGAGDRVRATLSFITLEQCRAGPTRKDAVEFPRQVVGIRDAAIHTQAALRHGDMRSIPDEVDAADLVPIGDERSGFPKPVPDIPQLRAIVAEATADEFDATALGQRSAGLGLRIVRGRQEPTSLVVDRDEQ